MMSNAYKYCLIGLLMLVPMINRSAAQDEASMQVLRKMLAELEAQSNQRAPANNSSGTSTSGTSDNRSVALGRALPREAPPPPVKETRVYDLADLFAIAPSFEAQGWVGWDNQPLFQASKPSDPTVAGSTGGMGGMGGGMGGMMRVPSESLGTPASNSFRKPTPSDLIEAIENTVDAEWASQGGKETMHWLGSSLLVTAYPETHTMVKQLLDLLQPRWNARVTLETKAHWLWLSYDEEEQLGKLMVQSDVSQVRSLDTEGLNKFMASLPKNEERPAPIHARLHSHNGQLVSWVSGTQQRTVANWQREKGKLIPVSKTIQRGVACEAMSMLAHASDHATIVFNSRYLVDLEPSENQTTNVDTPLPNRDRVLGQSIASTVRIPIGRSTIIGGGTSLEASEENWQLVLVLSVDLVSPRETQSH